VLALWFLCNVVEEMVMRGEGQKESRRKKKDASEHGGYASPRRKILQGNEKNASHDAYYYMLPAYTADQCMYMDP
jgi:hypothetical protein